MGSGEYKMVANIPDIGQLCEKFRMGDANKEDTADRGVFELILTSEFFLLPHPQFLTSESALLKSDHCLSGVLNFKHPRV